MMNKQEIVKAASIFVAKNRTMPMLANIACNGSTVATNLDSSINLPSIGVEGVYEPGALDAILNASAEIKSQGDIDEYPSITTKEEKTHVGTVNLEDFADLLKKHVRYISKDETRYTITGIAFDQDHVVSTDGHRLLFNPIPENIKEMKDCIIPGDFARKLIKLAKVIRHCKFDVFRSESFLVLRSKDVTISTRLVDGQFPDWKMVLPKESREVFTLVADVKKIKRSVKLPKKEEYLAELLSDGTMMVDQAYGVKRSFEAFLGNDLENPKHLVYVQAQYLIDALQGDPDAYRITIGDDLAPITIEGEVFTSVIMPYRKE